jgi:hypothetical protein
MPFNFIAGAEIAVAIEQQKDVRNKIILTKPNT